MRSIFQRGAVLLALSLCAGAAGAADVVKLVVPFAAGGPVDQVARILAPGLSAALGQNVIVDNRGGAGGTIGANYVAKSTPDGTTLLVGSLGFVMASGTVPNLPYNPRKDLEPVALFGQVQTLLVVRNSLGVNSLAELVAKARGGAKLGFGSSGVGSTMHIGGEILNMAAGTNAVHVPYRGAAPAIADLLAGNIDMLNADVPVLKPFVKDGRVKALVIYDARRSPDLPDVPDAKEAGMPALDMSNWYGALAPAGVPADVRKRLEAAFMKVLQSPETAARLADAGIRGPLGTAEFRTKLNADFDRWVPFVQKAGIRSE